MPGRRKTVRRAAVAVRVDRNAVSARYQVADRELHLHAVARIEDVDRARCRRARAAQLRHQSAPLLLGRCATCHRHRHYRTRHQSLNGAHAANCRISCQRFCKHLHHPGASSISCKHCVASRDKIRARRSSAVTSWEDSPCRFNAARASPPLPPRSCSPVAGATDEYTPEQNIKPSFVGTITKSTYDGNSDDLLTAGLGKTGLAGAAPTVAVPTAPTAAELRKLAIYNNYRALVDIAANGGYGTLYGPNVDVERQPDAGRRQDRRHRVPRVRRRRHRQAERDDDGADSDVVRCSIGVHRDRDVVRLARRVRRDRHSPANGA